MKEVIAIPEVFNDYERIIISLQEPVSFVFIIFPNVGEGMLCLLVKLIATFVDIKTNRGEILCHIKRALSREIIDIVKKKIFYQQYATAKQLGSSYISVFWHLLTCSLNHKQLFIRPALLLQ